MSAAAAGKPRRSSAAASASAGGSPPSSSSSSPVTKRRGRSASASSKRSSSSRGAKKSVVAATAVSANSRSALDEQNQKKQLPAATIFGLSAETLLTMFIIITLQCVVVHVMYVSLIKFQILVMLNVVAVIVVEMVWCRPLELNLLEQIQKSMRADKTVLPEAAKKVEGRFCMKWFYLSVVMLVLASVCNLLDHKRVWCVPHNHFFQFHSLWHFMSSIAMFMMWKHFSLRG